MNLLVFFNAIANVSKNNIIYQHRCVTNRISRPNSTPGIFYTHQSPLKKDGSISFKTGLPLYKEITLPSVNN